MPEISFVDKTHQPRTTNNQLTKIIFHSLNFSIFKLKTIFAYLNIKAHTLWNI